MIINTGQRTDIPAFYSEWFYNRIKEGYVYVRNPYFPSKVTKYILNPNIVDCICFCTKNPLPMLKRLNEIKEYRQFWFVTITPYAQDIEPFVPDYDTVINSFKELSLRVGKKCVGWRYDPIFISEKYNIEYHVKMFERFAKELSLYTNMCVISFLDLYKKTMINFPGVKEVELNVQIEIIKKFVKIADRYNIKLYTCAENKIFEKYGVNCQGCMSLDVIEEALDVHLDLKSSHPRADCSCLLGNDIGEYNTCLHGCLYCYANVNKSKVLEMYKRHDPSSPLLIGHLNDEDVVLTAKQKSHISYQLSLDL